MKLIKSKIFYIVSIFWAIALCGLARNLFSPRLLMINDPLMRLMETEAMAENASWVWITRLLNLYILIVCGYLIIMGLSFKNPKYVGRTIWVAMLIYAIGPFLASIFGDNPGVYLEIFYFPFVLTAIYLNGDADLEVLLKNIKWILLIYFYGSIISIIVNPFWSIQFPYETGVFPIPIRLFGLAESPQRMGPLLLLFMVVERLLPTKHWIKYLNWTMWGLVFIFIQEKIALISVPLLVFLFLMDRIKKAFRQRPRLLLMCGLLTILTIGMVVISIAGDPAIMQHATDRGKDMGIDTLTGRTRIWEVTLAAWNNNPLFGYGPSIWDLPFRMRAGSDFMHVGMAHNQFIQSLGEAGIIGLISLIMTIFMVTYYAWKMAIRSRWISVALILIPLIPTITETPFRNYFLGEDFFTLLCISTILIYLPSNISSLSSLRYDPH